MVFFVLTRFVLVKYSRAFVERPSQGTSSLASRLTTVNLDNKKTLFQVGIQEAKWDLTHSLQLKDLPKVDTEESLITYHFYRVPFGLVYNPLI